VVEQIVGDEARDSPRRELARAGPETIIDAQTMAVQIRPAFQRWSGTVLILLRSMRHELICVNTANYWNYQPASAWLQNYCFGPQDRTHTV
jgi:hypothetical protein